MATSKEEIVAKIVDELTLCYVNKGVTASMGSLAALADSLAEAIPFKDAEQVHVVFMRARDVEPIPTQKTLKEAWRNHGEEYVKYENAQSDSPRLAYSNPRAQWFPDDLRKRAINRKLALTNYCIAKGMEVYKRFCHLSTTHCEGTGEAKHWVQDHQEEFTEFVNSMWEEMRPLYRKYLRSLPEYQGFPKDAPFNFGMIPPRVEEFKWMLNMEAREHV